MRKKEDAGGVGGGGRGGLIPGSAATQDQPAHEDLITAVKGQLSPESGR